MIKFLTITALIFALFILGGCENITLTATSPNKIILNKIGYEVFPLTEQLCTQYDMDIFFANMNLNTAFLLKVTNYSDNPIKTNISSTFKLQDTNKIEHSRINNPLVYLKDSYENSEFSSYSLTELKEMEMEAENLLNSNIVTENIDYIQSQLIELKQKIYYVERKHIWEQNMKRQEQMIREKLSLYGFQDQMIFPQGSSVGLVIFPPLSKEQLSNVKLFFQAPPNKTISISYTVASPN